MTTLGTAAPLAADRPAGTSADPAPRTPTGTPTAGRRLVAALFLAPTVLGLGIFTFVPILASIGLSFFRWDVITAPEFVGLANFADLVTDPTVRRSFLNTFGFVAVAVVLQLVVALGLAVLVQSRLPGWLRVVFRSVFFFPLILSAASVSLVMAYLFNEDFGAVNAVLRTLGLGDVPWLTTGPGAAAVVVMVYVWQNFGFSFLLFLGGLSSIPKEVDEASAIDGATAGRRFRLVTLPLLSPTLLVASVMAMISALQIFDQPYVLTRGGPGDTTRTAVMVIYESAFQQLQFGRASAIGIVLTCVIVAVTALQFRLSRRYVHYQ
ncbi:ABC transporter permease subunit [Auraticoccus sp. F435]|uniref:ABC transporter permease subunit n=1 Tax=Auraticoccus cholistanensis TaxID=2656650 RepID=A0A6A9V071_9ACTN|nr:sugar ABC transporter permease [Auraticoccus cholistanensis]MVA75079.1 ABC transporter permease subunit [Auraticoccus cholistanensis]